MWSKIMYVLYVIYERSYASPFFLRIPLLVPS